MNIAQNSTTKADIRLPIIENTLSDGSKVYVVRIIGKDINFIEFDCITRKHALQLADKIAEALREHTNLTVTDW